MEETGEKTGHIKQGMIRLKSTERIKASTPGDFIDDLYK
jgi:hypothetical protein